MMSWVTIATGLYITLTSIAPAFSQPEPRNTTTDDATPLSTTVQPADTIVVAKPQNESEALAMAEKAYAVQDYIIVLDTLAPFEAKDAYDDKTVHRQVLEMLGTSAWFTGSLDNARNYFTELLQRWPQYRLEKYIYPSELIDFFESRRSDLTSLGVIGDDREKSDEPRIEKVLVRRVVENDISPLVYFAPFGVGQFVNGDDTKAIVVATLQGVGLAATIVSWWAIEDLKIGNTNTIVAADRSTADLLNGVWIGGASIFFASYLYSVIDGFMFQPPEQQIFEHYETRPIKTQQPQSLWFVPTGNGVGIGGVF